DHIASVSVGRLDISQTLIEQWDGTSWTIVSSPNTGSRSNPLDNNLLEGVTCASASAFRAVGYYNTDTAASASLTLVEHWDGTSWAIVSSPNTSAAHNTFSGWNQLSGVTCVSASDCWAVGYAGDKLGTLNTLTEHYALPSVQLNA